LAFAGIVQQVGSHAILHYWTGQTIEDPTWKSTPSWIPWILSPRWYIIHIMHFIQLSQNVLQEYDLMISDLILAGLLPALDQINKPIFTGNQVFKRRLCIHHTNLSQLIRHLCTISATQSDDHIRWIGFRSLSIFAHIGDDEMTQDLFTLLLKDCPFYKLRAASVGLVKEMILSNRTVKDFWQIYQPLLFQPPKSIFAFDRSTWNENTFFEYGDFLNQTLNLYLFLLIYDRNQNKVST
jgi:hypothetical protein